MSDNDKMISDEAVEAALDTLFVIFRGDSPDVRGEVYVQENSPADYVLDGRVDLPKAIRLALEAAAPHMLAAAWDEGEAAGQDNADSNRGYNTEHKYNPYRSQA